MMLAYIAITALIVLFLHLVTTPGMIFHIVEKTLKNFPVWMHWMQKPLYSCPACMCIWWGPTVVGCGIVWFGWQVSNTAQMFAICMAASTLNFLIAKVTPEKQKTCDCDRKKRLGLL